MDRRQAVRRLSVLVGAGISAPTLAGLLGGCRPGSEGQTYQPRILGGDAYEAVARLTEVIVPTTDTPGARAVGVPEFVDRMLAEWYPEEDRRQFLEGLERCDERCQSSSGSSLIRCNDADLQGFAEEIDDAAFATADALPADIAFFFRRLKEMTLVGYYTSYVGATTELRLNPMGPFRADVPLEEIERAWA